MTTRCADPRTRYPAIFHKSHQMHRQSLPHPLVLAMPFISTAPPSSISRIIHQSTSSALRRALGGASSTRGAIFSRLTCFQPALRLGRRFASAAAMQGTSSVSACAGAAAATALVASAFHWHALTAADDTPLANGDAGEYDGERDAEGRRHGFGKVIMMFFVWLLPLRWLNAHCKSHSRAYT